MTTYNCYYINICVSIHWDTLIMWLIHWYEYIFILLLVLLLFWLLLILLLLLFTSITISIMIITMLDWLGFWKWLACSSDNTVPGENLSSTLWYKHTTIYPSIYTSIHPSIHSSLDSSIFISSYTYIYPSLHVYVHCNCRFAYFRIFQYLLQHRVCNMG